jgi:hypothetical protein
LKNTTRMNNKGGINSDFSNLKVAENRIDDHEKLKIVVLAYYYNGMNREDQYNLGF